MSSTISLSLHPHLERPQPSVCDYCVVPLLLGLPVRVLTALSYRNRKPHTIPTHFPGGVGVDGITHSRASDRDGRLPLIHIVF